MLTIRTCQAPDSAARFKIKGVPSVSVRSLPTPMATGANQAGEGAAAPSS